MRCNIPYNIENKNYVIIESWVKLMANVSIRMDDALKKQAEDLFNDLGMNLTTAFTIFVKQSIIFPEHSLSILVAISVCFLALIDNL